MFWLLLRPLSKSTLTNHTVSFRVSLYLVSLHCFRQHLSVTDFRFLICYLFNLDHVKINIECIIEDHVIHSFGQLTNPANQFEYHIRYILGITEVGVTVGGKCAIEPKVVLFQQP